MRHRAVEPGRRFVLALDHGEDFFSSLAAFCVEQDIRSATVPSFVGGFRRARLVGTCDPLVDPDAPLWDEVQVESLEVLGAGTLAWDEEKGCVAPHIHVAAGLKGVSADGRVSHLLGAEVQFICEIVIVEELDAEDQSPALQRVRAAELYDVPLLTFRTKT